MTAVAAYVVLVVVLPALLLGHQGQDWPLAGAWRAVRARWPRRGALRGLGAPHSPSRDSSVATQALRASQGPSRRAPSWAHTQPLDRQEAA